MGEREVLAEQILKARLSRRGLLKYGMSAPFGAALLAACQSSSATQAPSAAASAAATAAPSAARDGRCHGCRDGCGHSRCDGAHRRLRARRRTTPGVTLNMLAGATTGPPLADRRPMLGAADRRHGERRGRPVRRARRSSTRA